MEQKTDRFYPSTPVENKNIDLEQRLEEKINNVKNHFNNIKEKITYLIDKNNKSKKKIKIRKL